jgi:dephospho-CoA kinase
MSASMRIGITGGIGAGKSLIVKIFNTLGIPSYDADAAAKYLMANDLGLKKQLIQSFGEQVFQDGALNRSYLATQVFNNPQKLNLLNSYVHPAVGKDFEQWCAKNTQAPYVLKEAALLFESGSYKMLDKIIVVTAPEALRIQRVLHRDQHRTEEQVRAIMQNQLPEEEKIKKADFLIVNDDRVMVLPQVLELHSQLIAL